MAQLVQPLGCRWFIFIIGKNEKCMCAYFSMVVGDPFLLAPSVVCCKEYNTILGLDGKGRQDFIIMAKLPWFVVSTVSSVLNQ